MGDTTTTALDFGTLARCRILGDGNNKPVIELSGSRRHLLLSNRAGTPANTENALARKALRCCGAARRAICTWRIAGNQRFDTFLGMAQQLAKAFNFILEIGGLGVQGGSACFGIVGPAGQCKTNHSIRNHSVATPLS